MHYSPIGWVGVSLDIGFENKIGRAVSVLVGRHQISNLILPTKIEAVLIKVAIIHPFPALYDIAAGLNSS